MTVNDSLSVAAGGAMGVSAGSGPNPASVEGPGTPGNVAPPSVLSPVAMKTSQEIVTSLHLIKDIRRLEKYQRNFFLKVK